MSHVNKEVAGVLGITLKHATTKHAQTIGLLERSHASIKQALKIETDERRSLWHKYVIIAVLNYNTSSRGRSGADGGGGGWGPTCIKISYSSREPRKVPRPCIRIGFVSAMY